MYNDLLPNKYVFSKIRISSF